METDSDHRIAEKILQCVDLKAKQVLEVGCGDGRITSWLADQPKTLIAIDPDAEKILEASQTIQKVIFQIGFGENLDLPENSFDIVLFTLSLHHQDSTAAIREARRVLRDDGFIIIIEPLIEGEIERLFALVHDENQAKLDAHKAIQNSGLAVEHSEIFYANWIFEDKIDLCHSIFAYYDEPYNKNTAEKMMDLLGSKLDHQPINVSDKMIIKVLKNYKEENL